jgi:nitroreductase
MNSTIDVMLQRKSLRAYSPQPISDSEKNVILDATLRAPTAGNMMLYTIIEVADQALKDRLVETCDNQPFIAKAPWVLLFTADYQRWFDYYEYSDVEQRCQELGLKPRAPQEGDLLLACCDALIAAHTAVLAAESLGIGSCYIGDILENYEIHRQMFSLPQYVAPVTLVCFGYPAKEVNRTRFVKRFDREYIVHQNGYRHLNRSELDEMMAPTIQREFSGGAFIKGAENFGQHNYLRKFIADFSLEMNRSVRQILLNWSQDTNRT